MRIHRMIKMAGKHHGSKQKLSTCRYHKHIYSKYIVTYFVSFKYNNNEHFYQMDKYNVDA